MGNPFVHAELATTDIAKAKAFYTSLFNWKLDDRDMGGGMTYTLIRVGEGTGGGMMNQMMPGAPSAWMPYVLVDDIRAATAKAKALGAKTMAEVKEVMGMGTLSIIVDPTGAVFGLWEPKMKAKPKAKSAAKGRKTAAARKTAKKKPKPKKKAKSRR